ncbi:hypothetical protein BLNAU_20256 [Blattamonas nauphoetae]|uniref:Uncharacterized protein n=1 Tax=Blattamonas nauphoetae TaxID=2049346 RepID=A0ABQ9WZ79_9EUKA|nr:hypothetical protein BLNAU_20256 [Blattamonas nauphoetae]
MTSTSTIRRSSHKSHKRPYELDSLVMGSIDSLDRTSLRNATPLTRVRSADSMHVSRASSSNLEPSVNRPKIVDRKSGTHTASFLSRAPSGYGKNAEIASKIELLQQSVAKPKKNEIQNDEIILLASRSSHMRNANLRKLRLAEQRQKNQDEDPHNILVSRSRSATPGARALTRNDPSRTSKHHSPEQDFTFITGVGMDSDIDSVSPERSHSPKINRRHQTAQTRQRCKSVNGMRMTKEEKQRLYSSPSRISSSHPSVPEHKRAVTPLIQTSLEMIRRSNHLMSIVHQRQSAIEKDKDRKSLELFSKQQARLSDPTLGPHTHGAFTTSAQQRQKTIRWMIAVHTFSRVGILLDSLVEDRTRRALRDLQEKSIIEQEHKQKQARMNARNEVAMRSIMILSRAVGRYVTSFRAKKRSTCSSLLLNFLTEQRQQTNLIKTLKRYRADVVSTQKIALSFVKCRKARQIAALTMWKEEESILLRNHKRRRVDDKIYPTRKDTMSTMFLMGNSTAKSDQSESNRYQNKNFLPNGVTLLPVLFPQKIKEKPASTSASQTKRTVQAPAVPLSPVRQVPRSSSRMFSRAALPGQVPLSPAGGKSRPNLYRSHTFSRNQELFPDSAKLDVLQNFIRKCRRTFQIDELPIQPNQKIIYREDGTTNNNLIVRYTDFGNPHPPIFMCMRKLRRELPLLIADAYERVTGRMIPLRTELFTKEQREHYERIIQMKTTTKDDDDNT